jgi:hypothetical protein
LPRVVSVSLGSSRRDKVAEATLLGVRFTIERRGTDGDMQAFQSLMASLDGKVDALGVGGADIWLRVGDRRFAFREIERLVSVVRRTPLVDGSGLKHTLEREAVRRIGEAGLVDWPKERALLVSGVDRFGMAEALAEHCPNVVYGDLAFGLGVPLPVRSFGAFRALALAMLPVVTRLPFRWFYPTGAKQDTRKPRHPRLFEEATVVCGDWHYIRRYAPERMPGKTVLTQTLRAADLEWLRSAGVRQAIATTPVIEGETFATNVMEGVVLTLLGKRPEEATGPDYLAVLGALGWAPAVVAGAAGSPPVQSA